MLSNLSTIETPKQNTNLANRLEIICSDLPRKDYLAALFILEQFVRHSDNNQIIQEEIKEILNNLSGLNLDKEAIHNPILVYEQKNDRSRLIAFASYTSKQDVAELHHFFVDKKWQQQGIGKKILRELTKVLLQQNIFFLKVTSGIRYQKSWEFYTKIFGKNSTFIQNRFGQGQDALSWITYLPDNIYLS